MSIFESTEVQIYGSRDTIREDLTDFAKQYLDLQTVDLTKTSFVSYIINVMSILASNQLFYSSTIYREGFLLEAQLTDSVYNLARWIGYTVPLATPSTVDVLFSMPLKFQDYNVTFQIPYDYKTYAGDIPFTVDPTFESSAGDDISNTSGITVNVKNNRSVVVRDALGFTTPVSIDTTTDPNNPVANFILPFVQQEYSMQQFQIPTDLEFFQFYVKRLSVTGQVNQIEIYIMEVNDNLFPVKYEISSGSGNYTIINSVNEIDTLEKFVRVFDESKRATGKWEVSDAGLFTLGQSDKKYVLTPYPDEIELGFGNGVIGAQPNPGYWTFVFISETLGEDGNIIPGSVRTSDQILYESNIPDANNPSVTNRKISRIRWSVVNTIPSTGGADIPTNAEVKQNAITNLRSKSRLVSGPDYQELNIIAPDLPIEESTEPILKRSDLKINEIVVFSQLVYDNPNNSSGNTEIVPTRNVIFPVDSTGYIPIDTTAIVPSGHYYVPRGAPIYVVNSEGENEKYQTLFDMRLDTSVRSAYYEYVVDEINITTSVISDANINNSYISIPSVDIESQVTPTNPDIITIDFNANVNNVQGGPSTSYKAYLTAAYMTNPDSQKIAAYETVKDSEGNITAFKFHITDFLDFPTGETTFTIQIYTDPGNEQISIYQFSTIIRQDLSDFMFSSLTSGFNSLGRPVWNIHDVPVVLSAYFQQSGFSIPDFERRTVQQFISNVKVNDKKMITDFLNIKMADTTGPLTNMQYNTPDFTIISYTMSAVPSDPDNFDSYLVNGTEGGVWAGHQNEIAKYVDPSWQFIEPRPGQQALVNNPLDINDPYNGQVLISNSCDWESLTSVGSTNPLFGIPFYIRARINRDTTTAASNSQIVSNIKTALLNRFSSRFGMDVDIDRSEIIEVIRGVSGVLYVELLDPFVDIRFKYELDDLTQAQLQDYTPQLVAFTTDTISVTVLSE